MRKIPLHFYVFLAILLLILIKLGSYSTAEYNVMDYGATGDDFTDDTLAFNNAIYDVSLIGGGEVIVPAGKYYIDPDTSVKMMDNTRLVMSPGTVLKAKPSASSYNAVIKVSNVSNVEVRGGKIIGDRYQHLGSEGAQGHGIRITGSNNVFISDVSISDCWGDGLYVGSTPAQNYCQNVTIEGIESGNNRRNGLSVISVKDLAIRNTTLSKSNGNLPQSGLCIEPNDEEEYVENILIENLKTIDNSGYGINFYIQVNSEVTINIKNFQDRGSLKGPYNKYMYRNETNPNYHITFS